MKMKNIHRLNPTQLTITIPSKWIDFRTTDELKPHNGIIGQDRAMQAVETGLKIPTRGYNIFVVGEAGSGKTSNLKKILKEKANTEKVSNDVCYVYNFDAPDIPLPLILPAGTGKMLAKDMDSLVKNLKKMIPRILMEGASGLIRAGIVAYTKSKADELTAKASNVANELGLVLQETENALQVLPVYKGKPLTEEDMAQLSDRTRSRIEKKMIHFQERAESFAYARRQLEMDHDEKIREAEIRAITPVVEESTAQLISSYEYMGEKVIEYLTKVQNHVIENYHLFNAEMRDNDNQSENPLAILERDSTSPAEDPDILYKVNVFVDRSDEKGAPVVNERMPTSSALCGTFEYKESSGGLATDHTLLKPGALHMANGGYLLIQAQELLSHEHSWNHLKRALRHKEIRIDDGSSHSAGSPKLAGALKPETVPLDLKVVLVGSYDIYYLLTMEDDNFGRLFKIMADFEPTMKLNQENIHKLARFAGQICKEEGYLPIHKTGFARILEFAIRAARNKKRLITRQAAILDILAESNVFAKSAGAKAIRKQDVEEAIFQKEYRHGTVRDAMLREIDNGTVIINTDGYRVGQVNGIAIYDMGGFGFGTPVRITAKTYVGRRGVVNIDREVNLSGAIHDKGAMIMIGYMGGRYAQSDPLGFSASITFEQSYDEIDGDSASATELFILLSSLSNCPINQGISVTGSVNQLGEIQPIGGVNEKIEGIFNVCKRKGLTGNEGVMIPATNVQNLLLKSEVIEAVKNGMFNIYAISTIDEGIEVLTGIKAGIKKPNGEWEKNTINYLVQKKLTEFVIASRNDIQSAINCNM
ncbi:MAG: AAA family ATPase [Deltaproteobacteria bacterium]|nr:AAA family ATPase [Deltaproteobacteria bacterium]